jgi:hypothetical protein
LYFLSGNLTAKVNPPRLSCHIQNQGGTEDLFSHGLQLASLLVLFKKKLGSQKVIGKEK